MRPSRLFLAVACVVISGCSESPEPAKQETAGSQSAAAISTNDAPAAEAIRLAPDKMTGNAEPVPESAARKTPESPVSPAAAEQSETSTATTKGPAVGPPPPVKQVIKPTPEQLAKWAPVEFEPLQMLSCRESSAIGFVAGMTHTTDGKHFILAGTSVSLWSVDADGPEHVFLKLTGEQSIKSLAVSPDGKWFAAGDSEGTLHIWSLADKEELHSKKLYSDDIIQIAISPDSKEIATISYDGEIVIWSADGLQEKNRFKTDTNSLKRIEYMTPGVLVASGETTSSWNVETGKPEKKLSPGRYRYTLARSPDGSR